MAVKRKKTPSKHAAACVECGTLLQGKSADSGDYCAECAPDKAGGFLAPSGFLRFVGYLSSFLSPLVGLALAVIFMPQSNPELKAYGKRCLIIALIAMFIFALFFFVAMLTGSMMSGAAGGYYLREGYY